MSSFLDISKLMLRMKRSVLAVLLMAIFSHLFIPDSALRCNVCISWVSWDDCAKSQDPLTCEPADSYCYRHSLQADVDGYKMKTFAKGCATSDKCTQEAINRCKNSLSANQLMGLQDAKCDLECCQGDLCI